MENVAQYEVGVLGEDQRKLKYFGRFLTFLNGNLYKQLSVDDLKSIVENKSDIKPLSFENLFNTEIMAESEIVMIIMACLFLDSGQKLKFDLIKKIFKLVWKLEINKKSNFNSNDSADLLYSRMSTEIDRDTICKILNIYQKFRSEYKVEFY